MKESPKSVTLSFNGPPSMLCCGLKSAPLKLPIDPRAKTLTARVENHRFLAV